MSLARFPLRRFARSRPRRIHRRDAGAFTLVEMLVVIVIVGVLAAISLKIAAAAREKAARDKVSAELAVIAGALEDYRRAFRSYPQVTTGEGLFTALSGKQDALGNAVDHRPFLSLEGLTTRDSDPVASTNLLLDPWNQSYVYRNFATGSRIGFRLYSVGPDGADDPDDETATVNLDNIYAHP